MHLVPPKLIAARSLFDGQAACRHLKRSTASRSSWIWAICPAGWLPMMATKPSTRLSLPASCKACTTCSSRQGSCHHHHVGASRRLLQGLHKINKFAWWGLPPAAACQAPPCTRCRAPTACLQAGTGMAAEVDMCWDPGGVARNSGSHVVVRHSPNPCFMCVHGVQDCTWGRCSGGGLPPLNSAAKGLGCCSTSCTFSRSSSSTNLSGSLVAFWERLCRRHGAFWVPGFMAEAGWQAGAQEGGLLTFELLTATAVTSSDRLPCSQEPLSMRMMQAIWLLTFSSGVGCIATGEMFWDPMAPQ